MFRVELSEFDYSLPLELIAQHPAPQREASRLMAVDRESGRVEHSVFRELRRFLRPDDLLVLNDTRVIPARLFGRAEGRTGWIEVLLVRQLSDNAWETLVKPGRKARIGTRLVFAPGFEARVIGLLPGTTRVLEFEYAGCFWESLDRIGHTPLPPYIQRKPHEDSEEDRERYQTVIARVRGSIAAPTAGLHFAPELLAQFEYEQITLHVGYGTFKPVKAAQVAEHRMDPESFEIAPAAAARIQEQLRTRRRVIAVGTTTTRALESVFQRHGMIRAEQGSTDLFIYPGFKFRVIGGLITNFHLPRSTLLMLVSAFAGAELVKRCYQEAVRQRYRFYSFGDAMLIL
jgi:S-adenosylmethionine:tRNA ribosyltransferase-isomerase